MVIVFAFIMCLSSNLFGATFEEEKTYIYPVRKIGELSVQNRRGNIEIRGWPLDKIRVTVRKTVFSYS